MNTKHRISIVFALALIIGGKAFGQEWELTHEFAYSDTCMFSFSEAFERGNGKIAVESYMAYKSGAGDFYSLQPAVAVIDPQKDWYYNAFFKPGFYTSNIPYVFEKNNTLYLLATYTPDHDFTYFNYHRNYEEQHDYAILGLYQLDEQLELANSYETRMAIDTFELRDNNTWQSLPNDFSGSLFLFSALQEDEAIVGAYVKRYSMGHYAPDSLFFFRMNYQGQMLNKVGYRMKSTSSTLSRSYFLRRHHIAKNGNGFIFFDLSDNVICNGKEEGDFENEGFAMYLDHDFNFVSAKAFRHPNHHVGNSFYDMSVIRSHHGTTYVATEYKEENQASSGITSCALYEYDDGEGKVSYLNLMNHIQRYQFNRMDFTPSKGIDISPTDWTLYFGYTLNAVTGSTDSWMAIEHLYAHFDTIRTMYYDHEGDRVRSFMSSITATNDGGCMIVYSAKNLDNFDQRWSCVTKFPAEAFEGIKEAHENGLKVAIAYPNPGKDVLNIRTGLQNAWAEVYDMNGRLIHSQALTENATAIDATDWTDGVYVWKVYVSDGGPSTGSGTASSTTPMETGKWIKE